MGNEKDTFITWLRDAYALERKLVPELKAHARDVEHIPEIHSKIQEHIAATERHAEVVKGILQELGSDVSTIKTLTGQAMGFMMGLSTAPADDEIVKNALAEFTMEHTEIASYISLIAAADQLHMPEAAQALMGILADEQDMADWLEAQIPEITKRHLNEKAGVAEAVAH